jgi:hypothetical protein
MGIHGLEYMTCASGIGGSMVPMSRDTDKIGLTRTPRCDLMRIVMDISNEPVADLGDPGSDSLISI